MQAKLHELLEDSPGLSLGLFVMLTWIIIAVSACVTTQDHGAGPCKEYKPICIRGELRCETDDRGCEFCTCS